MSSIATTGHMTTEYQVDKYIKHNAPERVYDINSVFASGSTDAYKTWTITSAASGSMEVDDRERTNFVYFAGEQTGVTFRDGKYAFPTDAVKLVLPFDEDRIHAYPVSSTGYDAVKCAACGASIIR